MKRRIFLKEEAPIRNNDHNEADAIRLPCPVVDARDVLRTLSLFPFSRNKITIRDGYGRAFQRYARRKFRNIPAERLNSKNFQPIRRRFRRQILTLAYITKTCAAVQLHEKLMALCRITVNDSLILRDSFEWAFARPGHYLNIVQLTLNNNRKCCWHDRGTSYGPVSL